MDFTVKVRVVPKLDRQRRTVTGQFYGDAAMRLLRDAVSRGYQDVQHMKKDPDLDPSRPQPDFPKLAAALAVKGN